jgi:hypothetical protein
VTARWRRWAFDPVDTAPMAALRIACALLTLGWALSLLPDAQAFLADDGLTSGPVDGSAGWWTVTGLPAYGGVLGLIGFALLLLVGWHTRVAAVVVAVGLIALQRRDVYVLNSGDLLLRELAVFVALMPSGECWSLDARRRGAAALRAPWGLRLLQVQVSVLYLFSVVAKLGGRSWQDGSAVGQALQLEDLQRLEVPLAVATSVTVSALLTYGTLLAEAFLVVGLWLPRTRWWAMAAGVSIHLGIEATLLIGWFSLAVIACYLAFVPAEVLRRVVGRVVPGRGEPARMGAPSPPEPGVPRA